MAHDGAGAGRLEGCFGRRLGELRGQRGLSQLQLAMRAGLSLRHVEDLEAGRRGASFRMLDRLADALGVAVRELFSFD